MDLVSRCVEDLPPLAWVAVLPRGGGSVDLVHGPRVELFAGAFFEGAWDGGLSDLAFDVVPNVFGSGGKVDDGLTLVSPSHTLECLYIVQTDGLSAASNSLAFLLRRCGLAFDPRHFAYGEAFSAIVYGLEHTPQRIELPGGTLTLLHHNNARLDADGSLHVLPKALPPQFDSYDQYRGYLCDVVGRAFGNAADKARQSHYLPLSTISSGYDASTSAAIARSGGCRETVGLATSNEGKPDSGRAVSEALGLENFEFQRMSQAPETATLEAEFLAPGMQGEDLVYSVFEAKLKDRILVTGFQGGKVWDKRDEPSPYIKRGDISGCSLGEFRLRNNFLHLPLPFVGIQRHPDIYKISNSAEMKDYSLGGSYDRPIPRRILEEAGVPRDLFGRAKRGASILLFQGKQRMSHQAADSIRSYCREQGLGPGYGLRLNASVAWWTLGRALYGVVRRSARALKINRKGRLGHVLARLCRALFGIKAPVFGASHPRFTLLLVWALAVQGARYDSAGRYEGA